MRTIKSEEITKAVRDLCIEANCHLPSDIKEAIGNCKACELPCKTVNRIPAL